MWTWFPDVLEHLELCAFLYIQACMYAYTGVQLPDECLSLVSCPMASWPAAAIPAHAAASSCCSQMTCNLWVMCAYRKLALKRMHTSSLHVHGVLYLHVPAPFLALQRHACPPDGVAHGWLAPAPCYHVGGGL